jgi:hypothetical protein
MSLPYPLSMRRSALFLLLAAFGLAACDTGSVLDENVVLTKTRTATFAYNCDERGAGQASSVAATMTIDFTGQLDGFRASDVVSARVTAARLVRRKPNSTNLNTLLRDVRLTLGGSGTVAQASTLPAGSDATLTATGLDVAEQVRAGAFQPRLAFSVVGTQPTECSLDAELTFRIELPGL